MGISTLIGLGQFYPLLPPSVTITGRISSKHPTHLIHFFLHSIHLHQFSHQEDSGSMFCQNIKTWCRNPRADQHLTQIFIWNICIAYWQQDVFKWIKDLNCFEPCIVGNLSSPCHISIIKFHMSNKNTLCKCQKLTLAASRDRKPKCERNSRAVWNS